MGWLALLAATSGCGDATRTPSADFIVAESPSGSIRCGDLRHFQRHARAVAVRQLDDETADAWRHRVLRQLADQIELAAEAERLGARADEPLSKHRLGRRQAILRESLEVSLQTASVVQPAEVERSFAEHARDFDQPELITSRFMLRKVAAEAGEEVWQAQIEVLLAARERILAGEAFGQVAREVSQAENAARGGAVKTSPRGTLLPEFEAVAWALEPGSMSEVVRLPDGAALILLERRTPARQATLEATRGALQKRLRLARYRELRAAAVAESCGDALPTLDADQVAGAIASGATSVRVGPLELDPATLALDPHAPWWDDRLESATTAACLDRTAEARGLAEQPDVAVRLAVEERGALAAWATQRRLGGCGRAVPQAEIEAFYRQHSATFRRPEQRRFEVLSVAIEATGQRAAQARAAAAAASWRARTAPPAELRLTQWGPLERGELAGLTSPLLARVAFSLAPGEVSDAVLLERFSNARANFETKGYVVLRLADVQPEGVQPLSEVNDRIQRFLTREERAACLDDLLAEVQAAAPLTIDEPALERCAPAAPPTPNAARQQRVSPSG